LIVLNQPLGLRPTLYAKLWERATYHVGADGGANCVYDMNSHLPLDTVIGDLDSLRKEVGESFHKGGSEIIHDLDQYTTDFTKAVNYLKNFIIPDSAQVTLSTQQERLETVKSRLKAQDIVVLGGLGGRVDQGMSTLHQLYIFQDEVDYDAGRIFLLSSESVTFVLKSGKHKINARYSSSGIALGNHVGIIPLKEPSVITTTGLEWDVTDWKTEFGGQLSTSNHVKDDWVTIKTTKDVLFTIDLVELDAKSS
jgi:thiamine pyrophosphokinase